MLGRQIACPLNACGKPLRLNLLVVDGALPRRRALNFYIFRSRLFDIEDVWAPVREIREAVQGSHFSHPEKELEWV